MNEVDEHLLRLIKSGDQEGWRQFVDRFQRRLIAFASKRVKPIATAEDLVQETFVSFLSSLEYYRGTGELESFLFRILRRRIIDHFRSSGIHPEIPVCEIAGTESPDPLAGATSTEPNASSYARRIEQNQAAFEALAAAIRRLSGHLQEGEKFKELEIAEGLFFARMRNRELAAALEISENEIAVVKRRLVQRLRDDLNRSADRPGHAFDESSLETDWLIQVWESERPSCPKRSTLGKYTLGILPNPWATHVEFHVKTLGCCFCNANLEELSATTASDPSDETRDRLFQSTIGFFAAQK